MTDNREDATHEGRPDRKQDDDVESERQRLHEAKEGKRDIGESDRGVERSDWNYAGAKKQADIPGHTTDNDATREPDDSEGVE